MSWFDSILEDLFDWLEDLFGKENRETAQQEAKKTVQKFSGTAANPIYRGKIARPRYTYTVDRAGDGWLGALIAHGTKVQKRILLWEEWAAVDRASWWEGLFGDGWDDWITYRDAFYGNFRDRENQRSHRFAEPPMFGSISVKEGDQIQRKIQRVGAASQNKPYLVRALPGRVIIPPEWQDAREAYLDRLGNALTIGQHIVKCAECWRLHSRRMSWGQTPSWWKSHVALWGVPQRQEKLAPEGAIKLSEDVNLPFVGGINRAGRTFEGKRARGWQTFAMSAKPIDDPRGPIIPMGYPCSSLEDVLELLELVKNATPIPGSPVWNELISRRGKRHILDWIDDNPFRPRTAKPENWNAHLMQINLTTGSDVVRKIINTQAAIIGSMLGNALVGIAGATASKVLENISATATANVIDVIPDSVGRLANTLTTYGSELFAAHTNDWRAAWNRSWLDDIRALALDNTFAKLGVSREAVETRLRDRIKVTENEGWTHFDALWGDLSWTGDIGYSAQDIIQI